MEKKLFLGGIGGQGVVFGGKLIGLANVENGCYATTYSSYSPAMRNGFTYSTIILSPDPVLAPVTTYYDCMAFFDEDSCVKMSHLLDEGGVYVLNSSLVRSQPKKQDAKCAQIRASHITNELGNSKLLNIVMTGAIMGACDLMNPDWMKGHLWKTFGKKPEIAELNIKAFDIGFQTAREQLA